MVIFGFFSGLRSPKIWTIYFRDRKPSLFFISKLSPVLSDLSLLEKLRVILILNAITTTAHLPRIYPSPSQTIAPTASCTYGLWRSCKRWLLPHMGVRVAAAAAATGSSDGDSTSPAIVLPYLDADTTLTRGGAATVGFASFDADKANQHSTQM